MGTQKPYEDWPECYLMEEDAERHSAPSQITCSERVRKQFAKRLPILSWLPAYKRSYWLSDLIAGITVWLTAIPQSMAYAAVAGLTPEYGLYSHFVGPFVYILLGSCRQVTIGPTAVIELVTFQTCGEGNPECVILMGFYSGIVELLFGLLQLGIIISFISEPVTIGFTAGAACVIASAQVKNILGLSGKATGSKFISIWEHIFDKITTLTIGDTVLGVSGILFLVVLQKLKEANFSGRSGKYLKGLFLARNALVVAISLLVAYIWTDPPFKLTGKVQSGFPPVRSPVFELYDPRKNTTFDDERMSFTDTLGFLGSAPVIVAFLAILQNVAISKAFGSGQTIDGTQEMIALGATNIIGGFFSCIPTSGSFTRSAVNEASGVKSQFNGLFVGILIIASLGLLTPSFQYIPKASLAAVVITAMYYMIEFQSMIKIWKTSKMDFLYCVATFLASLLLGMEYGILVGVGVSAGVLLLRSLRPRIDYEFLRHNDTEIQYIILKPDQGVYFPSADFIRDTVNDFARTYLLYSVIIIDCHRWTQWDYTSVSTVIHLSKTLEKNGKSLFLFRPPSSWTQALDRFQSQLPKSYNSYSDLKEAFHQLHHAKNASTAASLPTMSA